MKKDNAFAFRTFIATFGLWLVFSSLVITGILQLQLSTTTTVLLFPYLLGYFALVSAFRKSVFLAVLVAILVPTLIVSLEFILFFLAFRQSLPIDMETAVVEVAMLLVISALAAKIVIIYLLLVLFVMALLRWDKRHKS